LLARRELQEIVVLTSKLATQLANILTSKNDHLFSSFGISAGHDMGTVDIQLEENGQGGVIVNVTYNLTGLSDAGSKNILENFTADKYKQMLQSWKKMIIDNKDKIDHHYSQR